MVKTNEPGYVYILTNPSFREDWVKIGKSARPVDIRSKELDNTAVPLPFEIYATIQTVKYNDVEKHVHKTIDRLTDLRIRQNREFFNVPPQIALDIFNDIAKMIDDAVVTVYVDNKPVCHNEKDSLPVVQKRTVKRGRFKFSMVGIKIGECVTFIPTDTEVKVVWCNVKYRTYNRIRKSRWQAMIPLNTKVVFINCPLLSVRLCRKRNGIHRVHIKGQNISHIKGKCWMT